MHLIQVTMTKITNAIQKELNSMTSDEEYKKLMQEEASKILNTKK